MHQQHGGLPSGKEKTGTPPSKWHTPLKTPWAVMQGTNTAASKAVLIYTPPLPKKTPLQLTAPPPPACVHLQIQTASHNKHLQCTAASRKAAFKFEAAGRNVIFNLAAATLGSFSCANQQTSIPHPKYPSTQGSNAMQCCRPQGKGQLPPVLLLNHACPYRSKLQIKTASHNKPLQCAKSST